MTLSRSNPHLKSAADRKASLRRSAETSSAVEGIRAPFTKGADPNAPKNSKALTAYWKRRAGATGR